MNKLTTIFSAFILAALLTACNFSNSTDAYRLKIEDIVFEDDGLKNCVMRNEFTKYVDEVVDLCCADYSNNSEPGSGIVKSVVDIA